LEELGASSEICGVCDFGAGEGGCMRVGRGRAFGGHGCGIEDLGRLNQESGDR
jgi:hypothetical protein